MRVIYGDIEKPDSTYLIIIRGIDVESVKYFTRHLVERPTQGLFLCLDMDQDPSTRIEGASYDDIPQNTSICVAYSTFNDVSDQEVVEYVLKKYPRYDEDNDPLSDITPPSTDYLDSLSRTIMDKRFFERLIDPEKVSYKETFGVCPGEPLRTDTHLPVKFLQCAYKFGRIGVDRMRGMPKSEMVETLPPGCLDRIKMSILDAVCKCDNFWEVNVDDSDPFDIKVVVKLGLAPLKDFSEPRPSGLFGGDKDLFRDAADSLEKLGKLTSASVPPKPKSWISRFVE